MADIKQVLDFILNKAGDRDLAVITEALKRRSDKASGLGGLDVGAMARENARNVAQQMNVDKDQIRDMVRDFTVKIITQNAPELTPAQVEAILDDTLPDGNAAGSNASNLPADVLETMIRQFLSFSMNKMSLREQEKLHAEMHDWYEQYWKIFPDSVQYVLKDHIEGRISEEEYKARISEILNRW
ncbi:MAG: hypothetical protein JW874_06500 [Spirochaetales bacterium]|nr:hypothetical protein [Spirochaetales bacterium]